MGALGGCGDVQAGTRACGADVAGAGAARLRGVGVCCAARAQGEGDESDERCGVKTAHIAGLKYGVLVGTGGGARKETAHSRVGKGRWLKPRSALGGWCCARAQVEVTVAVEARATKFNETRLFSRRFANFQEKTVVSDHGTRLFTRRGRVFPRETRFYGPHRWGPPEHDFSLGGSRVSKRKRGRRAIGSTGTRLFSRRVACFQDKTGSSSNGFH